MSFVGWRVTLLKLQVVAAEEHIDSVLGAIKWNLIVIGVIEGLGERVVDVEAPAEVGPARGPLLKADQQRVIPTFRRRFDISDLLASRGGACSKTGSDRLPACRVHYLTWSEAVETANERRSAGRATQQAAEDGSLAEIMQPIR